MLKKLLPLLLIICLLMSGCAKEQPDVSSGTGEVVERKDGGTLRMGCVPIDTLNPLVTTHASVADVLSLVYEGLFVTLPDLTAKPVLASEYTVSENNRVYTIRLKDSVNFHNGLMFTSADVIATIEYLAFYGGRYSEIVSEMEMYYAEGDDTVVIRLKRSIADFVNRLDFPILPKSLDAMSFMPDNKNFIPVGTGPYKYSSALEHKKIYLEANKRWHDKDDEVYMDKVDVTILSDENTIISAFDVGSIDVVSTSWKNIADMNLTSSMYNIFECEQNRYTFIGINCYSSLFDSVNERRQLARSLDIDAITDDIMLGNAVAAAVPVRESVYFNGDVEIKEETGRIRRSIGGDNGTVKCTVLYNSGSKTKSRLASAVKQQLESKGYEVTLDEQPFEIYSERVMLDKYDLYIGEVNFDNCSDLSFMFGNLTGSTRMCNYFDSEFDNLVANLNTMNGTDDRTIAWNSFESYFVRNVVQIPLYFTNGGLLVNKRISGKAEPNISNLYYGITNMYIEGDDE